MYYYFMAVWVWLSLFRGSIKIIFSSISCHKNKLLTVHPLRYTPDPIKGLNDGSNSDLIEFKLNICPDSLTYDILPQNFRIDVFPVFYDTFAYTVLLNMLFFT